MRNDSMSDSVKLKDIADALQVSIVTVSNALSGKRGVSEEVRTKIIEKAEQMGYSRTKYKKDSESGLKIGVIVPEKYLHVGISFYWAMYQMVAYRASKKQSFTVFEMLPTEEEKKGELPKILYENSIDGLIIIGWVERSYVQKLVALSNVPVVLLDFYVEGSACDAVMSNNYIGMYKMTRYLIERGHKKIAFVGTIEANENIMDRYFGYRKAMEEASLPLEKKWLIKDRDAETGDMEVELPDELPTAFVCNCDLAAGLLYDKLQKAGYSIPKDVSIVGYDNYLFAHPFAEQITTYNVDMEQMAKAAVKILIKKIKGSDRHQGIKYIDSSIVERNSVRRI